MLIAVKTGGLGLLGERGGLGLLGDSGIGWLGVLVFWVGEWVLEFLLCRVRWIRRRRGVFDLRIQGNYSIVLNFLLAKNFTVP